MLIFWIIIFITSLILLVKSADWFVESSEKIGLALKFSPFIIGVTIVVLGDRGQVEKELYQRLQKSFI